MRLIAVLSGNRFGLYWNYKCGQCKVDLSKPVLSDKKILTHPKNNCAYAGTKWKYIDPQFPSTTLESEQIL